MINGPLFYTPISTTLTDAIQEIGGVDARVIECLDP